MDSRRLLVLSDTHGHVHALEAVLDWAQDIPRSGGIGAAVFLGDGFQDLSRASNATGFSVDWKAVRGNGDLEFSLPPSDVFDFGGRRFFLCHGHHSALHNGYSALVAAAKNLEADAALFGHTHVPYHENDSGIVLVNPGSVGRPRSRIGATFAVIGCEAGKPIEVEFWGIGDRGKIKLLTHVL